MFYSLIQKQDRQDWFCENCRKYFDPHDKSFRGRLQFDGCGNIIAASHICEKEIILPCDPMFDILKEFEKARNKKD